MAESIKLTDIIGDCRALLAPILGQAGDAPPDVRALLPSLLDPIAEGLAEFLDIDLVSHLLQAWSTAKELKALAAPGDPAELSHVSLKEHEIQLKLDPELQVTVAGVPVWKLPIRIILTATIEAARLAVRAGAIEAVTPGRIGLEGKAKWEEETLPLPLKRKDIDIPGTWRLDPPLPIARKDG